MAAAGGGLELLVWVDRGGWMWPILRANQGVQLATNVSHFDLRKIALT